MATHMASQTAQRGGIVMMLLFWVLLMAVGTWWIHGGLEEMMRPNANIVSTLPAGNRSP